MCLTVQVEETERWPVDIHACLSDMLFVSGLLHNMGIKGAGGSMGVLAKSVQKSTVIRVSSHSAVATALAVFAGWVDVRRKILCNPYAFSKESLGSHLLL